MKLERAEKDDIQNLKVSALAVSQDVILAIDIPPWDDILRTWQSKISADLDVILKHDSLQNKFP